MKKSIVFVFLLLIVFQICFIFAQDETISDKGYACLELKVAEKCSSLSTEEKIFSLWTIDRCKTEVMQDSSNNECWPNSGCRIKTTTQAALALNSLGTDTTEIETWLLKQKLTPPDVDWLLQIDAENPTTCTISYGISSYSVSIDENKKLDKSAGTCLKLYDNYWLEVSPTCYDEKFTISCDQTFSTSLLYRKKNSDIFYISNKLQSASAFGITEEKINSFCLGSTQTGCDYEGTLWAALFLKFRGQDVFSYLPYLVTMADENSKFLPESFLYLMTNNFKNELLLKQKENQYWSESGDPFYDTAVALYSLQSENPEEKTNAIQWLEDVQGKDGCWQGNIRNTAWILISAWPKKSFYIPESEGDCEDSGYYCMSEAACTEAGGSILTTYSGCFAMDKCCTVRRLLRSCSVQGGEICRSGEDCIGGRFEEAADTNNCCIGGECGVSATPDLPECETRGGKCKTSCSDNEEEVGYDCPSFDVCCIEKGKSTALPWIFGILILLTIIGIIFRKKLRVFWFKIKSKFKRRGRGAPPASYSGPRGFPPGSSSSISPTGRPRRILPPRSLPRTRTPAHKSGKEIDDVLKKLKEIGK